MGAMNTNCILCSILRPLAICVPHMSAVPEKLEFLTCFNNFKNLLGTILRLQTSRKKNNTQSSRPAFLFQLIFGEEDGSAGDGTQDLCKLDKPPATELQSKAAQGILRSVSL